MFAPSDGACTSIPSHPSPCSCSPSLMGESATLQQSQHAVRTIEKKTHPKWRFSSEQKHRSSCCHEKKLDSAHSPSQQEKCRRVSVVTATLRIPQKHITKRSLVSAPQCKRVLVAKSSAAFQHCDSLRQNGCRVVCRDFGWAIIVRSHALSLSILDCGRERCKELVEGIRVRHDVGHTEKQERECAKCSCATA